ncbi:hypothetical protein Sjap_006890 [Stephania japonica]|uniref:Subtilisin-like protease SBT1.5 n=1 Tax=Stephania japonica TaxID=461633 RepID=A0AAP0K937_9MAGN
MTYFNHVLPLLLFLHIFVFSPTIADENKRQTYIVQVQNDMKPTLFSTVDQWYRSTLAALEPSGSPDDADQDQSSMMLHVYTKVIHGFSAKLTKAQAEEMKARPEVLNVFPDQLRQRHTTRSPQFLGIINPEDHSKKKSHLGLLQASDYGSDVIIGVLDTGIWPESESFHDRGLGPVPSRWAGHCDKRLNFTCNRKIIGARVFSSGSRAMLGEPNTLKSETPRDIEGHGTHTASTAAGRAVKNASVFGYAAGTATGIAPKARLAIYKICMPQGCSDSDIIAGFDAAVKDGVDIVSLSVGSRGSAEEYSSDAFAIATFGAIDHGVFVSASAGNNGPVETSVVNVAPWITTVGAGSIDRNFPADLVLENGRVLTGSSIYGGKSLPKNKFFPLVYAGNLSEAGMGKAICDPASLHQKHVRGKIVICDITNVSIVDKGVNVKNAGGIGMVLANEDVYGERHLSAAHVLPAVQLGPKSRHVTLDYLAKARAPRATIVYRGTHVGIKPAPIVAWFSGRGPNLISLNIIKPDLIAPGVDILAAWPDKVGPTGLASDERRVAFNFDSGTSMSCPHVSGVAALLKGAHRDWSTARIKSAMMTTAYVRDNLGNPFIEETTNKTTDVWAYGSGHVDPEKAADPGLVFDLTVDDYVQFLCGSGYSKKDIQIVTRRAVKCDKKKLKPWDLNYPSIFVIFDQSYKKKFEVAATRTVTLVSKVASTYTVTIESPKGVVVSVHPSKLVFNRTEEKRSYVVNISAVKDQIPRGHGDEESVFGRMTWSDGRHVVGVPIGDVSFHKLSLQPMVSLVLKMLSNNPFRCVLSDRIYNTCVCHVLQTVDLRISDPNFGPSDSDPVEVIVSATVSVWRLKLRLARKREFSDVHTTVRPTRVIRDLAGKFQTSQQEEETLEPLNTFLGVFSLN